MMRDKLLNLLFIFASLAKSENHSYAQHDSCSMYIPSTLQISCDYTVPSYTLQIITDCVFSEFYLTIYNRYAEIIFYSDDQSNLWNAGNQSNGVYVYILETYNDSCIQKIYKGAITVLK